MKAGKARKVRESSLVMHTAGRGATGGGRVGRDVARGSRCWQKAEGSGDPGTSHRTNSRESGACLQAAGVGGGSPAATRGSRQRATPDLSPLSICSFSMVALRSWKDVGSDPDCANHLLGDESLLNLHFFSAGWENTAKWRQTVPGSDDPCHCLGMVLGTQRCQ